MRKGTLTRIKFGDSGTFGTLVMDNGHRFITGELPWRDNKSGLSCIPIGIYKCAYLNSPKHGMCYHVTNVEGRQDVEIHSANFMGDKEKGLHCELLGCIALGLTMGRMSGQDALFSSRDAITAFHTDLDGELLELTIVNSKEEGGDINA